MATTYQVFGEPSPFEGAVMDVRYRTTSDGAYVVTFDSVGEMGHVREVGLIFTEYRNGKKVGTAEFGAGPPPVYVHREQLSNGLWQYQFTASAFRTSGTFTFGGRHHKPCFVAGTLIATPDGPCAVEDLVPGSLVTLADGADAAVRWVGVRRCREAEIVRFRPGSLPVGPRRDLFTSDDHGMFVDGALVPAGLLVDGAGITFERRERVTFHHVELERHGILLAEGAPAESYLDTGNRRQFGNCPFSYDPARPAGEPCADLVLAGGRLERARALLPGPVDDGGRGAR